MFKEDEEKIVGYVGAPVSRKSLKNWKHAAKSLGRTVEYGALRSISAQFSTPAEERKFKADQFVLVLELEKQKKDEIHRKRIEAFLRRKKKAARNKAA